MRQHIGYISLLVRDYDEAISYFTGQLGFGLVEDTNLGNDKRWVLIAPSGSQETRILLAKAVEDERQELRLDALPAVTDADFRFPIPMRQADLHPAAGRSEFDGI